MSLNVNINTKCIGELESAGACFYTFMGLLEEHFSLSRSGPIYAGRLPDCKEGVKRSFRRSNAVSGTVNVT